jgi:hypothetical protein
MGTLGYDAAELSTDTSQPTGIGNVAARAVLAFRHRDGANQLGDEPGGAPGVPYSDYTGYSPTNDPMDLRAPFDATTVHDPAPGSHCATSTTAATSPHRASSAPTGST